MADFSVQRRLRLQEHHLKRRFLSTRRSAGPLHQQRYVRGLGEQGVRLDGGVAVDADTIGLDHSE